MTPSAPLMGRRPACAQPERQGEVLEVFPQRIGGNVGYLDRLAAECGRAARTGLGTDKQSVDGGGVVLREARAGDMAELETAIDGQHRANDRWRHALRPVCKAYSMMPFSGTPLAIASSISCCSSCRRRDAARRISTFASGVSLREEATDLELDHLAVLALPVAGEHVDDGGRAVDSASFAICRPSERASNSGQKSLIAIEAEFDRGLRAVIGERRQTSRAVCRARRTTRWECAAHTPGR